MTYVTMLDINLWFDTVFKVIQIAGSFASFAVLAMQFQIHRKASEVVVKADVLIQQPLTPPTEAPPL